MSDRCINYNILMQRLHDRLYLQAQVFFSGESPVELVPGLSCYLYTPTLRQRLSPTRYYVLLNIYYLEKPKVMLAYIQKQLSNSEFDLSQYLEALRSFKYVYPPQHHNLKCLKQTYEMLSKIETVKKRIAQNCSIPEDIGERIEGLGFRNQNLIDLQVSSSKFVPTKAKQRTSDGLSSVYSTLVVLIANLKECLIQSDFNRLWQKITIMAEKYDLKYQKIFDLFMVSLMGMENIKPCIYFLKKFKNLKTKEILKQLLRKLDNKYFQLGQVLVYRSKLQELQLQKKKNQIPPNQQVFKVLSLLMKVEIVEPQEIFSTLTPSVNVLLKLEEQRLNAQRFYVKAAFKKSLQLQQKPNSTLSVWGQLLHSSKLQLLHHLLLYNDFKSFNKILLKSKIKLDVIYHPNIIQTLGQLFEWIIEPLSEQIGVMKYFKTKTRNQRAFPEGYFKQCHEVTLYLFESLTEILGVGQSYIFSKKSTFIKTCRLFKQICSKHSKLSFQTFDTANRPFMFALGIIKRHLLPSIEYYDNDPSLAHELGRLIESFKFKIQYEIYTDSLNQRQLSNLHLAVIYQEVTSDLIRYLNRLTDSEAAIKKINSLLICHSFSCLYQIFQRLAFISKDQLAKLINAMNKTPRFTKKAALFFVFLQICGEKNEFDKPNSDFSKRYQHLIAFTHSLLQTQKKHEDFVKPIFEYFTFQLSSFGSDEKTLKTFDLFHGYIHFFDGLLQNLLPIELDECTINQHDRKYLVGGPLLKIKLMNRMAEFGSTRTLRSNISKVLFKPHLRCIFDNPFYFIVLKLNTIQLFIVRNLSYNIATTALLYDKFLKLILNIINIVHFETSSTQIAKYFNIKLFQPLVFFYRLPYEISFYIIRRSITEQMAKSKYDWNENGNWKELKNYFIQHFRQYFKDSRKEVKFADNQTYSEQEINFFLEFDVFLLFWIQDIEYSLFLPIYTSHITELEEQIQQKGQAADVSLKRFCFELKNERDRFAQIHYDLTYEQGDYGKVVRKLYDLRYIIFMDEQNDLETKYTKFCKMFIKYCILPRAMLSKSEGYYAWCFYFHFLKKNRLPVQLTIKLICLLLDGIAKFVPFATERQATELLPLLYNSAMAIFSFWNNLSRFNDKLQRFQLIEGRLTHEKYSQILYILYESQSSIISHLLAKKDESFYIKNCLHFISKCLSIPFCADLGQLILEGFSKMKGQCRQHKDIVIMIEIYSKQLESRLSNARMINPLIKKKYDLKYSSKSAYSLNQTLPDTRYHDDSFDPLNEYPNLSVSFDFESTRSQQKTMFASKSQNKGREAHSVIFEQETLEEHSDEQPKSKSKSRGRQKKKQAKQKPQRNRK